MTDRHWLAPVITWRSQLVQHSDCPTCKLVGLALSLYMNERGGSAYPSNATLAGDCSLGVSTVRQHLNEHLCPQGWLTLKHRGGQKGERRTANEWQATTPPAIGGVGSLPRQDVAGPRQQTAETPPATGPQVVQELDQEVVRARVVCSACGEDFTDTDALADHVMDDCGVLNGGEVVDMRAALRKSGGRG